MSRTAFSGAVLFASLLFYQTVWGHHSFAVYDFSTQIEFVGTVDTLTFRNPHVAMTMKVTNDDGQTVVIDFIEGAPANMLARKGLTPEKIQPGTVITAYGSPLIEDPTKYFLRRVRLADGSEYE